MKGTIADSIIIKVGHGIMTIPRDIEKIKQMKSSTDKKITPQKGLSEHQTPF